MKLQENQRTYVLIETRDRATVTSMLRMHKSLGMLSNAMQHAICLTYVSYSEDIIPQLKQVMEERDCVGSQFRITP